MWVVSFLMWLKILWCLVILDRILCWVYMMVVWLWLNVWLILGNERLVSLWYRYIVICCDWVSVWVLLGLWSFLMVVLKYLVVVVMIVVVLICMVLVLVIRLWSIILVSVLLIGVLFNEVNVVIWISVFLSLWILCLILLVMSLRILLGIVSCFICVFLCKMVMWVFSLGGCMLVISFYLKWVFSWFLRVVSCLGGWLDEMMICLLVLCKVLKVWKNFFWIFFLFLMNWMLLINSMFMLW